MSTRRTSNPDYQYTHTCITCQRTFPADAPWKRRCFPCYQAYKLEQHRDPPDGGESDARRVLSNHLRLQDRGLVGWWAIDPLDWSEEEIIGWTPGDH